MKSFGSFVILMGYILLVGNSVHVWYTGSHFLDMARRYREESRDKTASPEQRKHNDILGQVYSTAAATTLASGGFGTVILILMVGVSFGSQRSDARIRSLEEELKQLRTLVSGSRPQDV